MTWGDSSVTAGLKLTSQSALPSKLHLSLSLECGGAPGQQLPLGYGVVAAKDVSTDMFVVRTRPAQAEGPSSSIHHFNTTVDLKQACHSEAFCPSTLQRSNCWSG